MKKYLSPFILLACLAAISYPSAQAQLVVSSSSGVYRYSMEGAWEHTYIDTLGNWQGVAFDDATANIYAATASENGGIFQFDYDGTSVEMQVQSPAYQAAEPKMNLGLAFNQGLVIGNYYFVNLGLTQTGSFNPEGGEDAVPRPNCYLNSIGMIAGITASSEEGTYYLTDASAGQIIKLTGLLVGTVSSSVVATGLGSGIRGLALTTDESTLFVADSTGSKVVSVDLSTGTPTDFITLGVEGAVDVLITETAIFVSTGTGVDQYKPDGTLVADDLIDLPDARYLTTAAKSRGSEGTP